MYAFRTRIVKLDLRETCETPGTGIVIILNAVNSKRERELRERRAMS